MTRAERRRQQEAEARDWAAQQRERPNVPYPRPPAEESPHYCGPNLRGHRHLFGRSLDGRRRCYYCLLLHEDP